MVFMKAFIFYLQSIIGMFITHYIPTNIFWYWIGISLYIGHVINLKNYGKMNKVLATEIGAVKTKEEINGIKYDVYCFPNCYFELSDNEIKLSSKISIFADKKTEEEVCSKSEFWNFYTSKIYCIATKSVFEINYFEYF